MPIDFKRCTAPVYMNRFSVAVHTMLIWAELIWTGCISVLPPLRSVHAAVFCPELSSTLASTSISSDWNWGRWNISRGPFSIKARTCHWRQATAPSDDEWQKAGERRKKWSEETQKEMARVTEEAVFQSHLARGVSLTNPDASLLSKPPASMFYLHSCWWNSAGQPPARVCVFITCMKCQAVFFLNNNALNRTYCRAASLGWVYVCVL